MAVRPDASAASLALRTAATPAALLVAAATVGAAIFVSPWFLVPGVVVYGALLYALGLARRRRALDLSTFPPTIQRDLIEVKEALVALGQAARSAGPRQGPLFEGLLGEAAALEAAVERLAGCAARLHAYLAANNEAELHRRIQALEADLSRAEDTMARGQLEEALQASREQLQERAELHALLDRCQATMRNLHASAANIHSSVIKLASGQMTEAEMGIEPISELSEMRGTIAALEEVMQHTLH